MASVGPRKVFSALVMTRAACGTIGWGQVVEGGTMEAIGSGK